MRKILLLCFFLLSFAASAQDSPEPISAANISRLQSVAQIDFAKGFYTPPAPNTNPEEHRFIPTNIATGWFSMDLRGTFFGLVDGRSLVVVDDRNHLIGHSKTFESEFSGEYVTQLIDVVLRDSFPYGVYLTDAHFRIFYGGIHPYGNAGEEISYISADTPQSIWLDCETVQTLNTCYPWLEILDTNNQSYVMRMPMLRTLESDFAFTTSYTVVPNVLEFTDTIRLPYAPSQDPEAVVRIGRIPPPYTVTSSLEGIVKLWNLQTGETIYEVDNGTGLPSVFGAINTPPTHLVWRDNANEALYLLNFETGENRRIADLNGEYAQWYFLSPDATVILAVNLAFEPNIVAWDVATGAKTILGEYRQCNRPQPDMARLSSDGTTLVIGCDTGLDIWRIIN